MGLLEYKKKRTLRKTREPGGGKADSEVLRFVVQKHDASHLHYDFRLEMGKVLKSWAVPKGPSMNPKVKRLAVQVEDHPYDYRTFEGTIPEGNYGAGTVLIWDEGTYRVADIEFNSKKAADAELRKQWRSGKIHIVLEGKKLKGEFALVKAAWRGEKNWLLMKLKDEYATKEDILLEEKPAVTDPVTNPDKVYWPAELMPGRRKDVTKGDMLHYYREVAPYILPYLADRPQSLNRFPNGIRGKGFYQKDVTGKVPEWVDTYLYHTSDEPKVDKHFLVPRTQADVILMASMGCIEMNPWSSRTLSPDHPDWCIIDLDPGKNPFEEVIEAAQVTHKVLEAEGLKGYCKTSGSTGIHIYIPLDGTFTYEHSKEFARAIVTKVNKEIPAYTTLERTVSKRKGKMYLDFLQNRPQATVAAPYSLRPKPGAPVSMPLQWDEVRKGLKMTDFNIFNAIGRIRERGDLFKPLLAFSKRSKS